MWPPPSRKITNEMGETHTTVSQTLSYEYRSTGDLVKMQILIEQVWVGPEILYSLQTLRRHGLCWFSCATLNSEELDKLVPTYELKYIDQSVN